MFASRVPLNSRLLMSKNILPLEKIGESVRGIHVIHVPPRAKTSGVVKIIHGVILSCAMFFTPAWVLYHIPDYQKEDRNKYTGK